MELTPREIKDYLDKVVVGQEVSKKKVALEVYRQLKRMEGYKIKKNNILMTGLSGSGKTYMWQCISEWLDIPIYIQDCTELTSAGYVGADIENCLKGLLENADYDVEKAEYGIVVLDELDKNARKGENLSITQDVSGEAVQRGLLKMLEGKVSVIPKEKRRHPNEEGVEIDTSNILFVGCGSFEGIEDIVKERTKSKNQRSMGFGANVNKDKGLSLKELRQQISREDLKIFGMLPELLGRFSMLTNLEPLDRGDLLNILKLEDGIFSEYNDFFEMLGKKLKVNKNVYEYVVDKAMSNMTGARSLKAMVEEIMFDVLFDAPSSKKRSFIINKENIESKKEVC